MKKRKQSEESGSNWMDTYGDMVTLLLCFFVMLYSMSSVDQAKWIQLVKSFNPDAKVVSQIAADEGAESNDEVPGGVEDGISVEDFEGLYEQLKEAVESANLTSQVELYKGDGYTFITFRDHVFFDGDSPIIRPEGYALLDQFSSIIAGVSQSIAEIQVYGHTSQAEPNVPNNILTDRMLSAERSARVVAYIQPKCGVSPERLVSVGYGQFRPIAPFDTYENRAKNRRVEMLITKSDAVQKSLDQYYQEMGRTAPE